MRSVEGLRGAVTVTRAGSVEVELAGGLAEAGSGAECTPQTRFQIASVSKQFAIAGQTAYFHPGDNPGYQSFAAWIPAHAACVVILANEETTSIEGLLKQLL